MWRMTRVRIRETRLDNHPRARLVSWLSRGPFCPLEIHRFGRIRSPALRSLHRFNFGFGCSNRTVSMSGILAERSGDSFSRVSVMRPLGKVDTPKPCDQRARMRVSTRRN
ncbi:hypothetical protein CRG98_006725 [Punica granatum]|uniref:Uncharacterized protein n=1 Tax=Punica granatum TaxID=22663 RepID=A0A2I0KWK9_PUNGR|nr:hypothetical protein CRG98_006725 [Punica granatum]